jgi:hypothetical protein
VLDMDYFRQRDAFFWGAFLFLSLFFSVAGSMGRFQGDRNICELVVKKPRLSFQSRLEHSARLKRYAIERSEQSSLSLSLSLHYPGWGNIFGLPLPLFFTSEPSTGEW